MLLFGCDLTGLPNYLPRCWPRSHRFKGEEMYVNTRGSSYQGTPSPTNNTFSSLLRALPTCHSTEWYTRTLHLSSPTLAHGGLARLLTTRLLSSECSDQRSLDLDADFASGTRTVALWSHRPRGPHSHSRSLVLKSAYMVRNESVMEHIKSPLMEWHLPSRMETQRQVNSTRHSTPPMLAKGFILSRWSTEKTVSWMWTR